MGQSMVSNVVLYCKGKILNLVIFFVGTKLILGIDINFSNQEGQFLRDFS
jgi:hypothetical protein